MALSASLERKAIRSPLSQGNQDRNIKNIHQSLRNLLNSSSGPMAYPWYGQITQNQHQAGLYCQYQPGQYLLYQNHYFSNQHQYEYSGQTSINTDSSLISDYFANSYLSDKYNAFHDIYNNSYNFNVENFSQNNNNNAILQQLLNNENSETEFIFTSSVSDFN